MASCYRCNNTRYVLQVPREPLPVESVPCPECVVQPYTRLLRKKTFTAADKKLFKTLDVIMCPRAKQDKKDPSYLNFERCMAVTSFQPDEQKLESTLVEALVAADIPVRRQQLTPLMQRTRKKVSLPRVLFVNHADVEQAVVIYRKVVRKLKRHAS